MRHSSFVDRCMTVLFWAIALLIGLFFVWLILDLVRHGLSHVSWRFLTDAPLNAGRDGGISPIIVSTMIVVGVCLATSVPIGVGTTILLAEFTRDHPTISRLVRRLLDVLAGVPSIVFGLFGNAFFSITLGMGFSILAGGLTLACIVLPILIRSTEEGLRAVPDDYRRAGASLGMVRSSILWRIILPAASPAIAAGLVLGIGRALAETAALIFTSGYVDRMPSSLLDSGRTLSIHIYDLAMNVPGGEGRAYASALVLIVVLLILNVTAARIAGHWRKRSIVHDG